MQELSAKPAVNIDEDREAAEHLDMVGPHWAFSLSVYDKNGIPSSCLFLQDNYGVDVNVLLLSIYAAVNLEVGLNDEEIETLDESVRDLRESVIVPLRGVRRRLKDMPFGPQAEAIRNDVKAAELRVEQLEQAMIANWLGYAKLSPSVGSLPQTTAQSVARYYAKRCGKIDEMVSDIHAQEAINAITVAATAADSKP